MKKDARGFKHYPKQPTKAPPQRCVQAQAYCARRSLLGWLGLRHRSVHAPDSGSSERARRAVGGPEVHYQKQEDGLLLGVVHALTLSLTKKERGLGLRGLWT